MSRLIIFAIIFSVSYGFAIGQDSNESKESGIAVGLGPRTFLVSEEIVSGFNFSGSALSVHLAYNVLTDKQSRDFNLYFASPNLSTETNNNVLDGVIVNFDYHWRFRLKIPLPLDIKWYVGPYGRVQGFSRTFERVSGVQVIETNDSFYSLGVSSNMVKKWGARRQVQLLISAPILTYVYNKEYLASFSSEWLLPDRFADHQLRLAYQQTFLKAASFFVAYQYNIVIEERASRIAYGGHIFETGLMFSF